MPGKFKTAARGSPHLNFLTYFIICITVCCITTQKEIVMDQVRVNLTLDETVWESFARGANRGRC
jgi:hypothetical protein